MNQQVKDASTCLFLLVSVDLANKWVQFFFNVKHTCRHKHGCGHVAPGKSHSTFVNICNSFALGHKTIYDVNRQWSISTFTEP